MVGATPKEVLNMNPLERQLTIETATKKEVWKLEQLAKIFGGK